MPQATPLLHAITLMAFVLHIGGGIIGLVSGIVAVSVRKGGALHRKSGKIFVASMTVMAVFGLYLAVVMPDQRVNVFISLFALYLILTAWLTVRRSDASRGALDKIALLVGAILSAPFVILSFELATGLPPLFRSAVPFKGAVLIAIYAFTAVLLIAVVGDIRAAFFGTGTYAYRLSRHLWRMCLGLTLALGSGFTNGLARLLPGPYHVPTAFFFPQLVPLVLIVYWLIRVRSAAQFRKS